MVVGFQGLGLKAVRVRACGVRGMGVEVATAAWQQNNTPTPAQMCVCIICMYVCRYVHMFVRMRACRHVRAYVCRYVASSSSMVCWFHKDSSASVKALYTNGE